METNILFVSSEKILKQQACLFLLSDEQSINITFASNLKRSIEILDSPMKFDYIYLGHKVIVDDELKNLTKSLLPIINNNEARIIGTNQALREKQWAQYWHELTPHRSLIQKVKSVVNISQSSSTYLKAPISILSQFDHYKFNFYLAVEKNQNKNYILLYKKGAEFEQDSFNKYVNKGLRSLYIKKEELDSVQSSFKSEEDSDSIELCKSPNSALKLTSEYANEILKEAGFKISSNIHTLSSEVFKNALNLSDKIKDHKKTVLSLLERNEIFNYKHTSMTSLISCYILDELKLFDQNLKEKLCFSSFFQNIFLNTEFELKISDQSELASYSQKDKDRILNHAQKASKLLGQDNKISSDILRIITEQHGTNNGFGFSDKINSNLKLSLIFQIASDFSLSYLSEYEAFGCVDTGKIFEDIYKKVDHKHSNLLRSLQSVALKIQLAKEGTSKNC